MRPTLLTLTGAILLLSAGCRDARNWDLDGDGFDSTAHGGRDCDDSNAAVSPGVEERCNGRDDDCDGLVDDGDDSADPGSMSTWYVDEDGDGHGLDVGTVVSCAPPAGFGRMPGDCDDQDPETHPAAEELCDGVDRDCNGLIDDVSGGAPWFRDLDGDGFGAGNPVHACSSPGTGWAEVAGDCDDARPTVAPDAPEYCNGLDDDCDGEADDADPDGAPLDAGLWYADQDGDGFGVKVSPERRCAGTSGQSAAVGDCDDTNAGVHPGADEFCDDVDNDCDGATDESPVDGVLVFADNDLDGFGVFAVAVQTCSVGQGFTPVAGDCADAKPAINPAAIEICDAIDNDCDEAIDEADDDVVGELIQRFVDADGDGYGVATTVTERCFEADGWVADGTDCDDEAPAVSPAEAEECGNGRDDNCVANGEACALEGEADLEAGLVAHVIEGASRLAGQHFGSEVQFVDLNADGVLEIAVNTRGPDGSVLVLENLSQPGHTEEEDHRVLINSGGGSDRGRMAFGDLDGDGHIDLFYRADESPRSFTLLAPYLNAWVVFGPLDEPIDLPTYGGYAMFRGGGVAVTPDLTGDGLPDIIDSEGASIFITSATRSESGPLWCDGDGCALQDWTSPWWDDNSLKTNIRVTNHLVADVNGDGAADLVGWSLEADALQVFQGPLSSTGPVEPDATLLGPNATVLSGLTSINDIDGDGDPEVVLHAPDAEHERWIARFQDLVGVGDRELAPTWTLTNVPSDATVKTIASPWKRAGTSIVIQSEGLAWVVDAPSVGTIDVQTQARLTLTMPEEAFVAGSLDVNNNGRANLVVSHPGFGLNAGRILVLFPSEE